MLYMIDCTRMTIRSIKIKKLRKVSFWCMYLSMLVLYVCLKRRLIQLKQMRSTDRFRQCLHVHISLQGGIWSSQIPLIVFNCFPLAWSISRNKTFVSRFFLSCRIRIMLPVLAHKSLHSHSNTGCCKQARTYTRTQRFDLVSEKTNKQII